MHESRVPGMINVLSRQYNSVNPFVLYIPFAWSFFSTFSLPGLFAVSLVSSLALAGAGLWTCSRINSTEFGVLRKFLKRRTIKKGEQMQTIRDIAKDLSERVAIAWPMN